MIFTQTEGEKEKEPEGLATGQLLEKVSGTRISELA